MMPNAENDIGYLTRTIHELTSMLHEASARASAPEVLYEIMMATAEAASRAGQHADADSIRRTAMTMVPMFGRDAQASWATERAAMSLRSRLGAKRKATSDYVAAHSLDLRRTARAWIQGNVLR